MFAIQKAFAGRFFLLFYTFPTVCFPTSFQMLYSFFFVIFEVIDADTIAKNTEMNQARLVPNDSGFPNDEQFRVEYDAVRNMVLIRNNVPLLFTDLQLNPGEQLKVKVALLQDNFDRDTAEFTFTLIDWNNHEPVVSVVTPTTLPVQLTEGASFDSSLSIATVEAADDDLKEEGFNDELK